MRWIRSFWRRWRRLSHSQHHNDKFLTLFTVIIFATDKVKGTRPIKLKLGVTVLKLLDRVLLVTFLIILLVDHQNRVRSLLVLENESVTDLEPHPFSPVIVILRRVQNPPIFSTNVEGVGLRHREQSREKQEETKNTYLKLHVAETEERERDRDGILRKIEKQKVVERSEEKGLI